jgi:hypothetical protein
MEKQAGFIQDSQSKAIANVQRQQIENVAGTRVTDNRPEAITQRKLQDLANTNAQSAQLKLLPIQKQSDLEEEKPVQGKFETAQRAASEDEELLQGKFETVQRVDLEEEKPIQGKFETLQRVASKEEELLQGKFTQHSSPIQRQEEATNNTGLPDQLKTGIESLGGMTMDHVKVHYNSDKPAQLNAHAYAQGSDIHIAPGQEKHLPHEAWHVVQQAQGRVKPTMQMKQGVPVNDDAGLEHEADVMGAKAMQMNSDDSIIYQRNALSAYNFNRIVSQLAAVKNDRLNVIGEDHTESEGRIDKEKEYLKTAAGGDGYWDETTFKVGVLNRSWGSLIDRRQKGDPSWLHMEYLMSGLVSNLNINLTKSQQGKILLAGAHKDEHLWCWDSWMIFIDGVGKYIQTRFYDLSQTQVTALRGSLAESDVAKEKMEALNNAVETGVDQTKKLSEAHIAVQAFANKLYGAIRTMDVITNDRELSMHAAANAGYNLRGAWKIGDEHVTNLLDPTKAPRFDNKLYNVTTKDEFNAELP